MRINDRSKTDFDRAKIKLTGHFDRRPTGRYFEACVYTRLLCVNTPVGGASFQEGNLQSQAFLAPSSDFPPSGTKTIQSIPGSRSRWCCDGLGNSEQLICLDWRASAVSFLLAPVFHLCRCEWGTGLHTTITKLCCGPEFQCFCLTYFRN